MSADARLLIAVDTIPQVTPIRELKRIVSFPLHRGTVTTVLSHEGSSYDRRVWNNLPRWERDKNIEIGNRRNLTFLTASQLIQILSNEEGQRKRR